MNVEYSQDVTDRNVKVLLFGGPATRKTESILRFFPDVLLIDTEGNSDQCVGHPDIPPFLRIVTKDTREILDVLDAVDAGKITFPNKRPVQTIGIDGESVLWYVRSDVGAIQAEKRAQRYNKPIDEANMTQLDWVTAKKPLKRLRARMNGTGVVKYFIITAREKEEVVEVEVNGKKELVKTGRILPDVMKGLDYEVNLALNMRNTPKGWECEVFKVQGVLGQSLSQGITLKEFPIDTLLKHATGAGAKRQDEVDLAEEQAEEEQVHTAKDLMEIARAKGMEGPAVAAVLKENGINAFDPKRWEEMVKIIEGVSNE